MTPDVPNRLDLRDCSLRASTFRGVDLAGALFEDVKMSGAVWAMPTCPEPHSRTCAYAARGSDVDLRDAEIRESNLTGFSIDGILVTDLLAVYRSVNGPG